MNPFRTLMVPGTVALASTASSVLKRRFRKYVIDFPRGLVAGSIHNHLSGRVRGKEGANGHSTPHTLMKDLSRFYRLAGAVLGCAISFSTGQLLAQGSLQITSIQVVPGSPAQFSFNDSGTGATNYLVEFAPTVGAGGVWSNVTSAVVQSLGGGNFLVQVPDQQTGLGFFRVRGYGGAAGFISASFNSTALQATEGGVVSPTITFSAPYHGIVRYTISGTAMTGDYVSLSGEVFVNGTSATIPVMLLDNQSIGTLRYLTLTLQAGPALQLGAGSATTITIDENDADWQGTFTTGGASLAFVLRIQEANGAKMASLKGAGPGLFPTIEVPAGLLFTSSQFAASVGDVPVAASATLLNEPMALNLFLSAQNGIANQLVSLTQVQGTGSLISAVPGRPFLTTTNFGTFVLLKPPVKPSTNQVELVTAP